jgi:hypothetical protein
MSVLEMVQARELRLAQELGEEMGVESELLMAMEWALVLGLM